MDEFKKFTPAERRLSATLISMYAEIHYDQFHRKKDEKIKESVLKEEISNEK